MTKFNGIFGANLKQTTLQLSDKDIFIRNTHKSNRNLLEIENTASLNNNTILIVNLTLAELKMLLTARDNSETYFAVLSQNIEESELIYSYGMHTIDIIETVYDTYRLIMRSDDRQSKQSHYLTTSAYLEFC